MNYYDVTVLANETQSNEAMVATKEGLRWRIHYPALSGQSTTQYLRYFCFDIQSLRPLRSRGRLPPLLERRMNLGFHVDRLGDAEQIAHSLIYESVSPIAST